MYSQVLLVVILAIVCNVTMYLDNQKDKLS
jgi:hypothetical protein